MSLKLTHLDKIYWPDDSISKGDLLKYYNLMAPYILPYLKKRPVVLNRFPDGIEGMHFYQKESGPNLPTFVKTATVEHTEKNIEYFVVENVKTLLYIVNLGSIELHAFNARLKDLDHPDYFVFDLDPLNIPFEEVIKVARAFHDLLDQYEIPNYCKTTGGTGLHIFVPMQGKYDYATLHRFGSIFAQLVHEQLPSITSLERMPKNRDKKVYLDILQNSKMQTIACTYTVRGFPHAPVSTPLHWEEVKMGLHPTQFTIKNMPKRLEKYGDLFAPILKKGVNLNKLLKILENKTK